MAKIKGLEWFCKKLQKKYPDRWDTSQIETYQTSGLVKVICRRANHERVMRARILLKGANCLMCSKSAPYTTYSFIAELEKRKPGVWDVSEVEYKKFCLD